MQRDVATPEAMFELGVALGKTLTAGDLVLLTGALGAGKTTLTRGIGQGLGVRGPVTSPTFVLARTHPSLSDGPALVHVDAYRLADASELDDLDIDFENSVVVAEWGVGKFVNTHDSWLELVIDRPTGGGAQQESDEVDPDDTLVEPRHVEFHAHGPRWAEGVAV